MDKTQVFRHLSTQGHATLLDLLGQAYDEMTFDQRQNIFSQIAERLPQAPIDGKTLLEEIEQFHTESLAGVYYAPFEINSKNYMNIPEETNEWFDRLGDLLKASCHLTEQGEHGDAIRCLDMLFELISGIESGDEIVFGDEIGSWMIPGNEQEYLEAYLTSLAATATPEDFAETSIALLHRYHWKAHMVQVYPVAIRVANEAQRAQLEAEVQRQNIPTGATI